MCGITAFSRNPEGTSIPDGRKFLTAALHAIEHRGQHATGAAWGDPKTGWPHYWKEPGAAREVTDPAVFPAGMRVAIGHTRHATKGSPEDDRNNHPIVGDGMVVVHNGRVDNDDELIARTGHDRRGEVDSEAIVALLANRDRLGFSHPAQALGLLRGVAAIAWFDVDEPNVLHLARGSTRPMFIGWTKRDDLVMSSTRASLQATGRLAGVRIERVKEIPQGCYLRVVNGKVVEVERIRVVQPVRPVVEDVPKLDGIDWDNLVPRRGWA